MNPWEIPYDEPQAAQAQQMPWEVNYTQKSAPQTVNPNAGWSAITQPVSNFIDAQKQRGAALNDIVNATTKGQQSVPEGIAQGVMNEVGAAAQVPATALEMTGKALYQGAPQPVQKAVDAVQSKIAPIAQAYEQNQQAYNEQNPRAGRNFAATRELVNLLPLGSGEVRGAIGDASAIAGDAFKNVAGDTLDVLRSKTPLTAEQAKDVANYTYKMADEAGGMLKPQVRTNLINNLEVNLPSEESLKPGASIISQVLEKAKVNDGKPLTLSAAQEIDKSLTDIINGEYNAKGMISDEGRRLQDVQSNFRYATTNPAANMVLGGREGFDAYSQGVKNWSAMRKMEDLQGILDKAKQTDNEATSIKAGFRNLANNKNRMRGYTDEEKLAINKVADTGKLGDLTRTVLGSRLISGGLGAAVGAATGGGVGAIAGGMAGAGEAALSRNIAARAARGKAGKVMQSLSDRVDIPKYIYDLPPAQARIAMQKLLPAPGINPALIGFAPEITEMPTIKKEAK